MHDKPDDTLSSLAQTPAEVRRLVLNLPLEALVVRPSPDEFSILESVCHLRDVELEGYSVRIQRILDEDDPVLFDVDGARLAIERDYNRQNLSEALNAFSSARADNISRLKVVSNAQLQRTGQLEGVWSITLASLVDKMWEHDGGHLEELRRSRRIIGTSQ